MAEDQELAVADDVTQHLACVDLGRHSSLSWLGRRASTSLEGCDCLVVVQLKTRSAASPVVRE
jgi:hypothetical protein